mgnify:CR=1 FL=1
MNFKKRFIKGIAAVLTAAIFAGGLVLITSVNKVSVSYGVEDGVITYIPCGDEIAAGTEPIAQRDGLGLVLSEKGQVRLKKNGGSDFIIANSNTCFSSNDFENLSAFSVGYIDADGKYAQMHSSDCVDKGQYRTYLKDNSLYVQYLLGDDAEKTAFPTVVRREKFEKKILSKLNESDRAFMKRQYFLYALSEMDDENYKKTMLIQYPALRDSDIYVLVTPSISSGSRIGQRIISILNKVGYTYSDITDDNSENLAETAKPLTFLVTLKYSLTDGGVNVSVPRDMLRYYRDTPMTELILFRYLCSAAYEESGAVVLPCGTGSVIYTGGEHDNGIFGSFDFNIYGKDLSVRQSDVIYDNVEEPKATMPFYGVYTPSCGIFATIDSGAANVKLSAAKTAEGTYVYPTYTLLQTGNTEVGGKGDSVVTACKEISEDLSVTFNILDSGCDYNDFVSLYRNSLIKNGTLTKKNTADAPLFYAELIGNVETEDNLLNTFAYNKSVVLTDFSDSDKITEELMKRGIDNLSIKLTGWNKGGYLAQIPGTVKFSGSLGGLGKFKKLIEKNRKSGVDTYIGLTYPYYYNHSGSYASRYTAEYADKAKLTVAQRNPVSGFNDYGFSTEVISPQRFAAVTDKYIKKLSGYSCGWDVENFATAVNSDYNPKSFSDRSSTKEYVRQELARAAEKGIRLTAKDANQYALPYISVLTDVSYTAPLPAMIDMQIPFRQMVLHGSMEYCIAPQRDAAGSQHALLSAIESGSGLSYTFTSREDHQLKNTEYSMLNNNVFDNCKTDAVNNYNALKKALDGLSSVAIRSHRAITDTLVCVEYENGVKIYVNYGFEPTSVDGKTVEARSYLRCEA